MITVRGGDILATNGQVLTLRGINLQYGDNPQERLTSIGPIASTGANAIRLQLRRNTTAAQLRSCAARSMRSWPTAWWPW